MFKKTIVITALAIAAALALPTAALAAGYVPEGNITVAGDIAPGGTVTVDFSAGSFDEGEPLSFAVSGDPDATFAIVRTGTVTTPGTAGGDGSASTSFILPSNAAGTYTLTAAGLTSGTVGMASITVTPADSGAGTGDGPGLQNTGAALPVLGFWVGGGALLIGGSLIAVLAIARRQRAHA